MQSVIFTGLIYIMLTLSTLYVEADVGPLSSFIDLPLSIIDSLMSQKTPCPLIETLGLTVAAVGFISVRLMWNPEGYQKL